MITFPTICPKMSLKCKTITLFGFNMQKSIDIEYNIVAIEPR